MIQSESTETSRKKSGKIINQPIGSGQKMNRSGRQLKIRTINSSVKHHKNADDMFPENFKETLFEDSKPESP